MQLVTCTRHGKGPGYCACIHIADRAKAVHIVEATEAELGEALCAECVGKELTVDDLLLICAGCFAETQK